MITLEESERLFHISRDDDPRRPEILVTRLDESRWITTDGALTLVINNKAEARELIEALMEVTMTLSLSYLDEGEDA